MTQENPFKTGEVVYSAGGNGVGEGILWLVTAVKGNTIKVRTLFCVTGQSVLNPKILNWWNAHPANIVDLCRQRACLDMIINDLVKLRSEPETST